MNYKKRIRNFINILFNIGELSKYGGITKINIAQINYNGRLFTDDTIALITGGTRGIGYEIACKLVLAGATVIVTGRNECLPNDVKIPLQASENFFYLQWDISDIKCIDSKLDEIVRMTGHEISILINNAGIYANTQFPNCTSEDWEKVYATNAKGPFFLCQAVCKRWLNSVNSKRTKKIINISSQGGCVSANNPYRTTKWDIRGLTSFLGKNYASKGIISNAIAPGLVLTDMQPDFKKQGENLYTDLNPIRRIALPSEIAELALFLATDAANFIVGQTICCDGGYSLK